MRPAAARLGLVLALTLGLPMVLGACAGGDANRTGAGDPLPFGALPTDQVLHPVMGSSSAEVAAVREGRRSSVTECLQRIGYSGYVGSDESLVTEAAPTPIDGNEPFEMQRQWVARNGYGLSKGLVAAETAAPVPAGLSGDALEAFYDAQQACLAEATRRYPLTPREPSEISVIIDQTAQQISTDPEWLAAFNRWASCMRDLGYEFRERDDAVSAAEQQVLRAASPEGGLQSEVQIALADLECLISDVVAVQRAIEQRYNEAAGLI